MSFNPGWIGRKNDMPLSPIESPSAIEEHARDRRRPDARRGYRVNLLVYSSDDLAAWRCIKHELNYMNPSLHVSESGAPMVALHTSARDDLTASDFIVWRTQRVFDQMPELQVRVFVDRVTAA
jgi:hypothetical protein